MLEFIHSNQLQLLPKIFFLDVAVLVLNLAEGYLKACLVILHPLLLVLLAVTILRVFIIFCLAVVAVPILSIQIK